MKTVPLGKLTRLISSGSTPLGGSKIYLPNGSVMLIRSQNVLMRNLSLNDVAFVTEEIAGNMQRTVVKANDVLLNITGASIGRVATFELKEKQANVNQHVCIIRTIPELLHHRYLMHFIAQPNFQAHINNTQDGGTRQALTFEKIRNFQIPLPPIAQQRRIAAILDRADAVRRKRKEAIALTEALLRSAFLEMFGDPVVNPKGWETVTVGDIISDVRDGPHVSPEYSEAGIPIISTRNIRPSRLVLEDVKYISDQTYTKLVKYFKPQRGDVLLTKGGTTGFAKVVDWDWSFAIWVHIAALRPTERIRAEFLESALNSPSCYAQSQRYTHGIANRDLGLTRIRKIQLSLPPLPLQDQFCNFRQVLLKRLATQEQSLNESSDLFNSLLQRAFRGEL